jgi:hypothetical protein
MGSAIAGSLARSWRVDHADPKVRIAALQRYKDGPYHDLDAPADAFALPNPVRQSREFVDALKIMDAREKSQQALMDGDPKAALADLSGLERNLYARTPYFQNQLALAYKASADNVAADRALSLADQSPDQSIEGFTEHVKLLSEMKRFDQASALIARAEARLGDHKPFLPAMVAIAIGRKDSKAEVSAFNECMDTQSDFLRRGCRLALLGPDGDAKLDNLSEEDRAQIEKRLAQSGNSLSLQNLIRPIEDH